MGLLTLKLFLILMLNIGSGNQGRYEVEIKINGEEFKAYTIITTYDELKTEFKSAEEFKDFLFDIYGYSHLDSLQFYKEFHYINFPEYNYRDEKLASVLREDRITLSKSDIERIKFISLKKTDYIQLVTELNNKEIDLLQKKPEFASLYTIDEYQEGYSDLWILSYNTTIKSTELSELVLSFKMKYESKSTKGKDMENSWIYREMIDDWQKELKSMDVYLLEIINP